MGSKWLRKFQEIPLLPTDKTDSVQKSCMQQTDSTDIVPTMSVLSVPTLGILLKNKDIVLFFKERAAIMEFDGGIPKEQAEHMASLYALKEFITINYPDVYKQFELIISQEADM